MLTGTSLRFLWMGEVPSDHASEKMTSAVPIVAL